MQPKHTILISLLALTLLSNPVMAHQRLTSRFLYFCNDPQCMIWPAYAWEKKYLAKNRAVLHYATDQHFFYRYTPTFNGLSGTADIFVYTYGCNPHFDKDVLVEVVHAGKTDTLHVDFTSPREQWVRIGSFPFTGEGKEFVHFTRTAETNNGVITPILPIRFDLYYDTKTQPQTETPSLPVGLSTKGNWKTFQKSCFRSRLNTLLSTTKGDVAYWNPGQALAGKLNIYLFRPNVHANDLFRVAHNGKVDHLQLKDLTYANLNLFNPTTAQGWYKLGEFDFSGKGNEYLELEKLANDSSLLDCMMLERVNLDGTLLDRMVVTPMQFDGKMKMPPSTMTLEAKIQATKQVVGLSPNNNGHSIVTSSKNGSTIYSRALYSNQKVHRFVWNPCIVEPGEYDLYYFAYYQPSSDGQFDVFSNGTQKTVSVEAAALAVQQQNYIGTYTFAGGIRDEFVVMKNINRASDVTFERKLANGALLKQVVVTAHPYFVEYTFEDTKDLPECHDLGEMVRRGFAKPLSSSVFGVNGSFSVNAYSQIVGKMLDSVGVKYTRPALWYGVETKPSAPVTMKEAAQLMLNAMECAGRYTNVRNYFKKSDQAMVRMAEAGVFKSTVQPEKTLNRKEATLLLKDFFEQILCSGPPARADWELTFSDEFEGDQIDWDKWYADDAVRFKGVSAKWKENCVVEDGLFKGYNYLDNHEVPYSSGNLNSVYRQTYGFFEARYKYPDKAYGSHSSFWSSSKGGDFNYNEGAYPNSVSNNNYFMRKGENFNDFAMPINMAHDFHTVSGYLNDKDLYYGMDGKITWEVKDYPSHYGVVTEPNSPYGRTTNFPYNAMISTVVTYFDGPLDRDRIDGSYMACDWVRVYKEIQWEPTVESLKKRSDTEWVLTFNKPMDASSISGQTLLVDCKDGSKPRYRIEQINPLRYRIVLESKTVSESTLLVSTTVKDTRGHGLAKTQHFKLE